MDILIGEIYKRDYSEFQKQNEPYIIQFKWEFEELLSIVKNMKCLDNILEVGSAMGGSLYHLIPLLSYGGKIASIDMPTITDTMAHKAWPDWVPEGISYKFIQANSHLVATKNELLTFMPEVDFLFIDGDHTYSGVKSDFIMYAPLVKKGGIIALHDITPHSRRGGAEVHKLWQEIREAGYITRELHSMPNQDERGIGIVYC